MQHVRRGNQQAIAVDEKCVAVKSVLKSMCRRIFFEGIDDRTNRRRYGLIGGIRIRSRSDFGLGGSDQISKRDKNRKADHRRTSLRNVNESSLLLCVYHFAGRLTFVISILGHTPVDA